MDCKDYAPTTPLWACGATPCGGSHPSDSFSSRSEVLVRKRMLISHHWVVLTFAAVMKILSGASGQTIHIGPNHYRNSGARCPVGPSSLIETTGWIQLLNWVQQFNKINSKWYTIVGESTEGGPLGYKYNLCHQLWAKDISRLVYWRWDAGGWNSIFHRLPNWIQLLNCWTEFNNPRNWIQSGPQ